MHKMPQEKTRNVCTVTNPLGTSVTHQQNEILQELSANISNTHNTHVIDNLGTVPYIPVE